MAGTKISDMTPADAPDTPVNAQFPFVVETPEGGFLPSRNYRSPLNAFRQAGVGAEDRTLTSKLRDFVNAADYGFSVDNTAAENLVALDKAMTYLLDRFPDSANYYPGVPPGGTRNPFFSGTDRQTGEIRFPAGRFMVPPNLFSSLDNPRAIYCGFEFVGSGKMSTILCMETGGVDSWFYDNGAADPSKFQQMHWKEIGFRSDDPTKGSVIKKWSDGGPKQFRFTECDFQNLWQLFQTEGTGNADLNVFTRCTGMLYGDILTLDNGQAVSHDFISCSLKSFGRWVRVKENGGGNVNIIGGAWDLTWHDDYSPADGIAMYWEDDDATVGQGNCIFNYDGLRVEVEVYTRTAGSRPIHVVRTAPNPDPDPITAMPRVAIVRTNFVNGKTYTINADAVVTGEGYRRITAVELHERKYVAFTECVLLKTFFYSVTGSRDTGSPSHGGIIDVVRCFDGIPGELPSGDSALENLHSRVTYTGSAGRVRTTGMVQNESGNSFVRKLLDADPRWQFGFASDPGGESKKTNIKHVSNGLPLGTNASSDSYIDLPPGLLALRLYVSKAATTPDAATYQLHLKVDDRSGAIIASSTLGTFGDAHLIDVSNVDLTGITRVCLCASGTYAGFYNIAITYIEYV